MLACKLYIIHCSTIYAASTHGEGLLVEVDDGALVLAHNADAVLDALRANARVLEALEREVVGASGWWSVNLESTR